MNKRQRWMAIGTLIAVAYLFAQPAQAHVKWFSEFSFVEKPLTLTQAVTPTFIGLSLLSLLVIGVMVFIDRRLDSLPLYGQVNDWLSRGQPHSLTIMRFAIAGALLVNWASDSVLAPELMTDSLWIDWLEFWLAILLLIPRTTPLAGAGILFLYLINVLEYGPFHMLDYLHFIGIGVYFLTANHNNERIRGLGLPALYATIGFALIWLGYEKLVYPSWGLYILEQQPVLTLGLPAQFFLQAAAFVEISLGYLLIIGLLERPLAAVITLVFFTTTLVFGKLEVIGHTPIHAALIIFLLNGPGHIYRPPIGLHQRLNWRVAFATVNFLLALLIFGTVYTVSADFQYDRAVAQNGMVMLYELDPAAPIPTFNTIELLPDTSHGTVSYNLHVDIDNWTFTPALAGQATIPNEGHAHVYLNGNKIDRMYGDWLHLGSLPPGNHTVTVTLNGNDHLDFAVDGEIISAEIDITIP